MIEVSDRILYRPATIADAIRLGNNLRWQDTQEVLASHGIDGITALISAVQLSSYSRTVTYDGRIVLMLGIHSDSEGGGSVWMLSSPLIHDIRRPFLVYCKPVLAKMLDRYSPLYNFVDARNKVSIRWLKWLGFEFSEPMPYGVERRLFYFFEKRRETPCADH